MDEILTLKGNYNPRQSRECSYDVRAFEFSSFFQVNGFLLPTFECGFL